MAAKRPEDATEGAAHVAGSLWSEPTLGAGDAAGLKLKWARDVNRAEIDKAVQDLQPDLDRFKTTATESLRKRRR